MAHVQSHYLDETIESDAAALPLTENDQAEAAFILDLPLTDDTINRIVNSQTTFEKNNLVVSDYCVESQKNVELENPNAISMSSSILDNQKYFAPPNSESSQYMWNQATDVRSHHQYAQSPNIYTNDYMTSEPSDYVYM
uniref:Fork-head domain-containing protein n=1 Tax=Caenorhabditis tropicalis TaxID=1561998 RepID=A0A1I7T8N8_9PELO